MNNLIFRKDDLTEIVFNNRNKNYGAYVIRNSYENNMRKAMVSVLFLIILFISLPRFFSLMGWVNIPDEIIDDHTIYNPISFDDYIPFKKPDFNNVIQETPKPTASMASMKVVQDKKVTKPTPELTTSKPNPDSNGKGETRETGAIIGTGTTGILDTAKIEIIEPKPKPDPEPEPKPKVNKPENIAEVMPEFNGGYEAMVKFIQKNLVYPANAKNNNIQGTVHVKFIVNEDGSISHTKILRGIGGGCDEEAARVINKMPEWKAGSTRGEKLKVYMSIPIKFVLE